MRPLKSQVVVGAVYRHKTIESHQPVMVTAASIFKDVVHYEYEIHLGQGENARNHLTFARFLMFFELDPGTPQTDAPRVD